VCYRCLTSFRSFQVPACCSVTHCLCFLASASSASCYLPAACLHRYIYHVQSHFCSFVCDQCTASRLVNLFPSAVVTPGLVIARWSNQPHPWRGTASYLTKHGHRPIYSNLLTRPPQVSVSLVCTGRLLSVEPQSQKIKLPPAFSSSPPTQVRGALICSLPPLRFPPSMNEQFVVRRLSPCWWLTHDAGFRLPPRKTTQAMAPLRSKIHHTLHKINHKFKRHSDPGGQLEDQDAVQSTTQPRTLVTDGFQLPTSSQSPGQPSASSSLLQAGAGSVSSHGPDQTAQLPRTSGSGSASSMGSSLAYGFGPPSPGGSAMSVDRPDQNPRVMQPVAGTPLPHGNLGNPIGTSFI
jgi:hypothetical protein